MRRKLKQKKRKKTATQRREMPSPRRKVISGSAAWSERASNSSSPS